MIKRYLHIIIMLLLFLGACIISYNLGIKDGYNDTLTAFKQGDMDNYVLREMGKELYNACGSDSYCRDVFY